MVKILVASHTYIVKLNCTKLRLLANLAPEHQVTVIVPKFWRPGGVQSQRIITTPWVDGNFRLIPVHNWSENNQGLLTFSPTIINLLKEFQPDIIQVELGVKSLAYAQLITLNRLLNLRAKNVFFTWWNLPYQTKFPLTTLFNYNLRHTDGLLAGNQDAVDILKTEGYTNSVAIIPQLGVDEQLFQPQPQPTLATSLGIQPEDFVIGFVGRFVQEKGILTLLEAVNLLKSKHWKLLLLGRGSLEAEIKQQVQELGIAEKVIIIPSVPHDRVPNYLNLLNVLVLPSQTDDNFKTLTAVGWKEQFGHVLIEAMACQIPVIGSDSGEIPNVIGDSGLIFTEGNPKALASCLQRLLSEPDLVKTLVTKGYQRVMTKYTNLALAKQQLDFYLNLNLVRQ